MELEIYKLIYETEGKRKDFRILGDEFVKNNENRAKLIINNKKFYLQNKITIKKRRIYELKIKMILITNLYNKSYMFKDCTSLIHFSIKDKIDINIKDDDNNEENIFLFEKKEEKEEKEEKEIKNIFDEKDGYSSFNKSGVSEWPYNKENSFNNLSITRLKYENENQDIIYLFLFVSLKLNNLNRK